jgi:limonene-1,2-epoxide hydrolase
MALAEGVVREFLAALESLDVDRVLTLAHPEIVYQNVPLPPARGRAAFERQMRGFTRLGDGFEARIHHLAVDGSVVLTERTDVLQSGSFRASFWVCGTFEVRDGAVVLWRDYFDWLAFIAAVARGGARALLHTIARR